MNTFAILILSLTLFFAWEKDRCVINPIVVTSSVWLFLLIGYEVVDHGLFPLSDRFYVAFLAWMIPFQITCYVTSVMVNNNRHLQHPVTPLVTNKYVILFVSCCMLFVLVMNYKRAMAYDSMNLYNALRTISIEVRRGNDELAPSALQIWANRFAQLGFVMCLIYSLKGSVFKYKYLFYLLVFAYLLEGTNKLVLLRFFIGYLAILVYNKKINIRLIIFVFVLIFLSMYAVQFFRRSDTSEELDLIQLIYIYVFSPLPAFDSFVLNNPTAHFTTYFDGEFVFKNFPFIDFFLGREYASEDVCFYNYGMVYVPVPTNVYSMLSGYWVGWKWTGLIFGGLFHGIFWGYIYERSKKMEVYKVFYAANLYILIFWFFHEYLMEHIRFIITLIIFLFFILYNPIFKEKRIK